MIFSVLHKMIIRIANKSERERLTRFAAIIAARNKTRRAAPARQKDKRVNSNE